MRRRKATVGMVLLICAGLGGVLTGCRQQPSGGERSGMAPVQETAADEGQGAAAGGQAADGQGAAAGTQGAGNGAAMAGGGTGMGAAKDKAGNSGQATQNGVQVDLKQQLETLRGGALQGDQPIFPTNDRLYTIAELAVMSDEALAVFRNELYARHGRIFSSEEWARFFGQFTWYEARYAAGQFREQEAFSDLEKENLKLVLGMETERKNAVLFTWENYPRVDGSTATIPLSEQYAADAIGATLEEARGYVLHNKTHEAYLNLIDGRADIIFVTAPSEEELQLAAEAGVELEITPVVKEGFVFLVNEQNAVTGLTRKQIRDIYSGKITDWKDVGGKEQAITAFQRPINSGSQTGMLSLVMEGTPLMAAPADLYLSDMGEMVSEISAYKNSDTAIGYSYFYFVRSMYFQKGIRLLAIDGVEPGRDTIQDGSYPYTTAYYAVIKKSEPTDSSARRLLRWIQYQGGISAEKAGYVPVR